MKNVLPHPQWHFQTTTAIGCIAGPIIGLGYGYILYKYKNNKIFEKNQSFYQCIFYTCYCVGFGIILVPGFLVMVLKVSQNTFWASLFNAINRPFFTIAVGFLLLFVMHGFGWITKYVLEWSPLYILGRLTYSAYLVHLSIVLYRPAISRYPIYISDSSIILGALGDLAATYLMALFLTLMIEMPVSEFQKQLLPTKFGEVSSDTKKE